MVDLKLIRESPDAFKAALRKKRADPTLVDQVLEADRRRRDLINFLVLIRTPAHKSFLNVPSSFVAPSPTASEECCWQFIFRATTLCVHPEAGQRVRRPAD